MLDSFCITAISKALTKHVELTTLSFRSNLFGESGSTALASILAKLENLCYLDIGNNNIGPKGCGIVSSSLEHMMKIQFLYIDFNHVGVQGAKALAAIVPALRSLQVLKINADLRTSDLWFMTHLDLRSRGYREEDGFVLAEILKRSKCAVYLDLRDNEWGDSISDLADAVFCIPRLKTLNECPFSSNHSIASENLKFIQQTIRTYSHRRSCTEPVQSDHMTFGQLQAFDRVASANAPDGILPKHAPGGIILRHDTNHEAIDYGCRWSPVSTISDDLSENGCSFIESAENTTENVSDSKKFDHSLVFKRSFGDLAVLEVQPSIEEALSKGESFAVPSPRPQRLKAISRKLSKVITIHVPADAKSFSGITMTPHSVFRSQSPPRSFLRSVARGIQQTSARYGRAAAQSRSVVSRNQPQTLSVELRQKALQFSAKQIGPQKLLEICNMIDYDKVNIGLVDFSLNDLFGSSLKTQDLCGFTQLCSILENSPGIRHLNFSWTNMCAPGMQALKPVLCSSPYLMTLDLYKNNLGSGGMLILASALIFTPNLLYLNLRYNALSSQGAIALSDVLTSICQLTFLDVAHNESGEEGTQAIAKNLVSLDTLRYLDIREINKSRICCQIMVKNVLTISSLTQLNGISSQQISEEDNGNDILNYEILFAANILSRVDSKMEPKMRSSFQIKSLDLSSCDLTDFPFPILQLTSLLELDISSNSIQSIPHVELCEMEFMSSLACHCNNQLDMPPPEVAAQGGQFVMRYLRSTLASGRRDGLLHLILIGPAGSGKTACLKGLQSRCQRMHRYLDDDKGSWLQDCIWRPFDQQSERSPVALPTAPRSIRQDLSFSIVQLPGDNLHLRYCHTFFRRRAMYVLFWRAITFNTSDKTLTKNNEEWNKGMRVIGQKLSRWVDALYARVPSATVIVAVTSTDKNSTSSINLQCEWVQLFLKDKQRQMECMIPGSSLQFWKDAQSLRLNASITVAEHMTIPLCKEIVSCALSLPFLDEQFPNAYIRFKNAIRAQKQNFVTWDNIKNMALESGIESTDVFGALRVLHEQGVLLCLGKWLHIYSNIVEVQEPIIEVESEVLTKPRLVLELMKCFLQKDRENLHMWFEGEYGEQNMNHRLADKLLIFQSTGVLHSELIPYFVPLAEFSEKTNFSYASAEYWSRIGYSSNLHIFRDFKLYKDDYSKVLNIFTELGMLIVREETNFVIPCATMDRWARVVDARALSPTDSQFCCTFSFPATIPSICFETLLLHFAKECESFYLCNLAAVYFKLGAYAHVSWRKTEMEAAELLLRCSDHRLFRRLLLVLETLMSYFPSMRTSAPRNIMQSGKETVHVTLWHTVQSTSTCESLMLSLQHLDNEITFSMEEISEWDTLLFGISNAACSALHNAGIHRFSQLREFQVGPATPFGLADKLRSLEIADRDILIIRKILDRPTKDSRIVICCVDQTYLKNTECDLHPLVRLVRTGVPVVQIFLPTFSSIESRELFNFEEFCTIAVLDLQKQSFWEGENAKTLSADAMFLVTQLHDILKSFLKSWRGSMQNLLAQKGNASIPCSHCVLANHDPIFLFEKQSLEKKYQDWLKTLDPSQEMDDLITCPSEVCPYCSYDESCSMILLQPSSIISVVCPSCIKNGCTQPSFFERSKIQQAMEMMNGGTFLFQNKPAHKNVRGPAPRLSVSSFSKKAFCVKQSIRCIQCESLGVASRISLLDILIPDISVSFYGQGPCCPVCSQELNGHGPKWFCTKCSSLFPVTQWDRGRQNSLTDLVERTERRLQVVCVKRPHGLDLDKSEEDRLEAITKAPVFLVFLSDLYLNNPACCHEFSHAVKSGKPIVPVLAHGWILPFGGNHSSGKADGGGGGGLHDETTPWFPPNATYTRPNGGGERTVPWSALGGGGSTRPVDMRNDEPAAALRAERLLCRAIVKAMAKAAA